MQATLRFIFQLMGAQLQVLVACTVLAKLWQVVVRRTIRVVCKLLEVECAGAGCLGRISAGALPITVTAFSPGGGGVGSRVPAASLLLVLGLARFLSGVERVRLRRTSLMSSTLRTLAA